MKNASQGCLFIFVLLYQIGDFPHEIGNSALEKINDHISAPALRASPCSLQDALVVEVDGPAFPADFDIPALIKAEVILHGGDGAAERNLVLPLLGGLVGVCPKSGAIVRVEGYCSC